MKPLEEEDELAGLMDLEREAIEQGALGSNLPAGTKVEFAPDSATRPESAAERMPIVPKVVQVPGGMDDVELAAAQLEDRRARAREAFERGGRQMVAGLTRTQEQPIFQQGKDAVARLLAKRKDAAAQAQLSEQNRLGAAKLNYDKEQDRQRAETRAAERTQDLEERERDNLRAEKGIESRDRNTAAMMGLRFDEAETKKQERTDKASANSVPLFGGTYSIKEGLSDSERGKARDVASLWQAADSAVENFQAKLEAYARSPSIATKGDVTAALRTASSAFNSAIGGGAMSGDEARAMSEAMGADILTPTGAQALLAKVFGDDAQAASIISGNVRAAREANRKTALGRLQAYGTFSGGQSGGQAAPARPTATGKNGEKYQLSEDGKSWEPIK